MNFDVFVFDWSVSQITFYSITIHVTSIFDCFISCYLEKKVQKVLACFLNKPIILTCEDNTANNTKACNRKIIFNE